MEGVKYTPILNDFATLNYQDPVRPNTPDVVYNPLYQETVLKYSQENFVGTANVSNEGI